MNILVDIGNSNLKYVSLVPNIQENICRTNFSEIALIPTNQVCDLWMEKNWKEATKIIVASVSQFSVVEKILSWCLQRNKRVVVVESEKQAFGITSGYTNPKQLGVDRWLALLGAKVLYPNKNTIIVDSGTATTVDILSSDGNHIGGWILPGVNSMQKSILKDTANVDSQPNTPNLMFGTNSSVNVSNGCWAATIGLINLAGVQCRELGVFVDDTILTGGNSKELHFLTNNIFQLEPQLIFHGLKHYI